MEKLGSQGSHFQRFSFPFGLPLRYLIKTLGNMSRQGRFCKGVCSIKQGNGITLTWDPQECEYYLPSRAEASILPPPLLTECSFIWLRTLDYLESLLSFPPHPRASLRTLRPFTYDNVVSSGPVRPALLAGHAASQYLSSVIKPRTRTLKYRFLLPPRQARPLPPSLAGQFHS